MSGLSNFMGRVYEADVLEADLLLHFQGSPGAVPLW